MDAVRPWLLTAALLGGLAVALGAFGAHGLPGYLQRQNVPADEIVRRMTNWETAARYQMYHALALLAVAWLASISPAVQIRWAGLLFTVGTLVFSGCLYALVITGFKGLGAVVPFGGLALIAGWALLAAGALAGPRA